MEAKKTYFKELRLITAEIANRFGVPAEAPVFVSPQVNAGENCDEDECDIVFTPLVYQVGYDTIAQHLHESSGGIYQWSTSSTVDQILSNGGYKWTAFLVPSGEMYPEGPGCVRSQSTRTTMITALCHGSYQYYEGLYPPCNKRLTEGFLTIPLPYSDISFWPGNLLPLCNLDSEQHKFFDAAKVKYSFRITDSGEVHFGNI